MMILWLSVLAAFSAVGGMLCFLVHCGRVIDAEAKRVEEFAGASAPSEATGPVVLSRD